MCLSTEQQVLGELLYIICKKNNVSIEELCTFLIFIWIKLYMYIYTSVIVNLQKDSFTFTSFASLAPSLFFAKETQYIGSPSWLIALVSLASAIFVKVHCFNFLSKEMLVVLKKITRFMDESRKHTKYMRKNLKTLAWSYKILIRQFSTVEKYCHGNDWVDSVLRAINSLAI